MEFFFFKKLISDGAKHLPITHVEMTRFWITLQQGVDFVLKNFERMQGGEIFVPKIPSARIIDLAESLAPGMEQKLIGIRPGEKIHETMCPADDSHLTCEFDDHFVIIPSIKFNDSEIKYSKNLIGENGVYVKQGFEYNSGKNQQFLNIEELNEYDKWAEL